MSRIVLHVAKHLRPSNEKRHGGEAIARLYCARNTSLHNWYRTGRYVWMDAELDDRPSRASLVSVHVARRRSLSLVNQQQQVRFAA